jgi:Nucleoside-diphosphate-sugar epimerases
VRKIVVTGATSFIGIHLINLLLEKGVFIYAIVRPNSININRIHLTDNIKIIEADLSDYDKLHTLINDQIDICYHLAWEGARIPYRDDVVLQQKNYDASISLMNCCKEWNVGFFLGIGSQAEYGKCIGNITEEYETNPTTEYGKAKLKACVDLMAISKRYKIKFIWTRLFSAYGIYDYSETLISSVVKKLMNNEEIKLTECVQNWDFINVEDVAEIMYLFGIRDCNEGIYNVASGRSKPLKEFVFDMKRITNSQSNLLFGAVPYNSEGVVSFKPIVDKLKNNLNWICKVTFEEGIRKIISHNVQEGNL